MKTIKAIKERRSIKHYDSKFTICEAEISSLLELALLSPTSFNIQNWRFVVVTDPAKKTALRTASYNQAQVSEASVVIILCANLSAHFEAGRYWIQAPLSVQETIVPMITSYYENNAQLQRDEAMRSIGIASQTIMLAAKSMGYDSCPMIGFDCSKVAEIIKLPSEHIVGMMLTIGKSLKKANLRSGQLPYNEVVFRENFPNVD